MTKEQPDFIVKMLAGMVGIEPSQFQTTIEQFIHTAQNMGAQMNRIEFNTIQLLEAENLRRKQEGKTFLPYYDASGSMKVGS